MVRLHHSYAGYLRSMQMSTTQLYVFVEGKQCDPYFFAQICKITISPQISYDIATAQQLPGNSGGKQALLQFFSYLRQRNALVMDFGERRTTCVFFLDKDVDDLQRKRKHSLHVIYTKHYDVQNYVFDNGDLVTAGAAAASVDPRRLQPNLQDASAWCQRIAGLWRDWIALCLYIMNEGPSCEANYRVPSRLQSRPCETTDPEALQTITRDIARRAGIPVADLRSILTQYRSRVDRHLRCGAHHKIFKGKWFGSILADDIDRIMAGDPYDMNGLAGSLPCAIAATLDFSKPWAEDFRGPLQDVAKLL